MIAINTKGEIVMDYVTTGMFRGYIDNDGKSELFVFKNPLWFGIIFI